MSEITSYEQITLVPLPCARENATLAADGSVSATWPIAIAANEAIIIGPEALALVCERASVEAGFTRIERCTRAEGILVVATDDAERTLVSEVFQGRHGWSTVTEVSGVRDGSCSTILNAFDAAAERLGMRAAARKRESTGGVCVLASTRRVLGKRLRPAPLDERLASETVADRRSSGRSKRSAKGRS